MSVKYKTVYAEAHASDSKIESRLTYYPYYRRLRLVRYPKRDVGKRDVLHDGQEKWLKSLK